MTDEVWVTSGTRYGATFEQCRSFADLVVRINPREIHHGDCVGWDATAHMVAQASPGIAIYRHPADIARRAWCYGGSAYAPAKPLVRNRVMIDIAKKARRGRLVAVPLEGYVAGGGTWYAVRYALRMSLPVTIIWPDGKVKENWHPPERAELCQAMNRSS